MNRAPKSKIYFVKKQTESDLMAGRKPLVGTIVEVNPKNISQRSNLINKSQVISIRRDKKPRSSNQQKAQQKLQQAIMSREQRFNLPILNPLEEQTRQNIKSKGIVAQQEQRAVDQLASQKQQTEQRVEAQKTKALLALPPALEKARLAIEGLSPQLQQQLIALQNVAPETAGRILQGWEQQQADRDRFLAQQQGAVSPSTTSAPSPIAPTFAGSPSPVKTPLQIETEEKALDTIFNLSKQPKTKAEKTIRDNQLKLLRMLSGKDTGQYGTTLRNVATMSSAQLEANYATHKKDIDENIEFYRKYRDAMFSKQQEEQRQGVGKGLKFKGGKLKMIKTPKDILKHLNRGRKKGVRGGAIAWDWQYLDPSRGISEQLQDYFIKGMVGQANPLRKATLAEIEKVGGDEMTLEYNHRYWDAKDESNRLFNAVAVDNQARADAPSAAERIATNLTGAVAEGAVKALTA